MKSNEQMIAEVTSAVHMRKAERRRQKRRRRILVIVIAVLAVSAVPAVAAARHGSFLDLFRHPEAHIHQIAPAEEVESLRKEIAASSDPFSHADPYSGVLPDHETAVRYGSTVEDHGLAFTFVEIVNGKAIMNEVVSGSIAGGDITMQDRVEEKTFAVIEVRRADRAPLTDAEQELCFLWHRLVSGYKPADTSVILMAEPYQLVLEYRDENCIHYLVDLSSMLIFADHTLALAVTDQGTRLDGKVFIADQDGNYEFREEKIDTPHALFYFDLPDAYADPEAVKAFEKQHPMGKNFKNYRK